MGDLERRHNGDEWVVTSTVGEIIYEGRHTRLEEALREVCRQLPEPD